MIPKAAIEKAIEGGWRPTRRYLRFKIFTETTSEAFITSQGWTDVAAFDAIFWRALESATGKTARAMYLDFCAANWDAETDRFWEELLPEGTLPANEKEI